jgi:hypothetical protein
MIAGPLVLLMAAAAAPTPPPTATPTPPINILLAKPGSEAAPPSGSLADYASRIKLKLPEGKPKVLTNENVKQLAEGIELTTTVGGGPPARLSGAGGRDEGKKAMWQQRYRDAVGRIARLEADVKRLKSEANRLETEFYAHDDPAQRDQVIKPAWDRALGELRKAEGDLEEARKGPDEVLNAARRDGALPGWFRGLDEAAAQSSESGGSPAIRVESARPAPPTATPTLPPPARPAGPT